MLMLFYERDIVVIEYFQSNELSSYTSGLHVKYSCTSKSCNTRQCFVLHIWLEPTALVK